MRSILNEQLYNDRTVQHWHRAQLHNRCTAIDVDLYGYCDRCSAPIYLLEATSRYWSKPTYVLQRLAKPLGIPVILVQHQNHVVMCGRQVFPEVFQMDSGQAVADYLTDLHRQHHLREHPRVGPNSRLQP